MYIFLILLSQAMIGGLDLFVQKRKLDIKGLLTIILDMIWSILITMMIFCFGLNNTVLFDLETYTGAFGGIFTATAMAVGLVLIAVKAIFRRYNIIQKNSKKRTIIEAVFLGLSVLLFSLGSILYFGVAAFTDFIGRLTPEQFMFNMVSKVSGAEEGAMSQVYVVPILSIVFLIMTFTFIFLPNISLGFKDKTFLRGKGMRILAGILGLVTFAFGAFYATKELQLDKVYQSYAVKSDYIDKNYVDPAETKVSFPEKKRNLIHIYLESYENSYYDKSLGGYGYKGQNIMPDLEKITKEGINFSQNEKFGGAYQTYGSSWSTAGMMNMMSGLPLKIPAMGDSYGKTGYFMPGATMLGDILHKEGYEQVLMLPCEADFGGLTELYKNHGNFKIMDAAYFRDNGFVPKDYKVWWGVEDEKIVSYAKDELTRLGKSGKPFNFTFENADSHFPDGYEEPNDEAKFDQHYANVIFNNQKLMVEFINWIKEQPFYDNTTVVITGDHLSMDKKFFADFDPDYHRTTVNTILNYPKQEQVTNSKNRDFAPFDMFPTIISSLDANIEGNKLGLGTDLFSNEKTLIERDGLDEMNGQFVYSSNLYNSLMKENKENIQKVKDRNK